MTKQRALEIAIQVMNAIDLDEVEQGMNIDLDELDEAIQVLETLK